MPTTHTLTVVSLDSTTPVISFFDWIKTLSPEDQAAANLANNAQTTIIAKHQASGKLLSVSGSDSGTTFVWADGSELEQAEHDPEFTKLMERYKEATNTTHKITVA